MPTYQIQQWKSPNTKSRPNSCGMWYVTGYDIHPNKPTQQMFLRKDSTWQHVMSTTWLPDGGSFFTTKNEAEIALAMTGQTDHTNSLTAEGNTWKAKKKRLKS